MPLLYKLRLFSLFSIFDLALFEYFVHSYIICSSFIDVTQSVSVYLSVYFTVLATIAGE